MATFLQIVGAVFVALLLVVLAVILFLKWKIRSWANQMAGKVGEFRGMMEQMAAQGGPMAAALGGMLEPLSLTLRPTTDEPDEDFALQIKAWTRGLTAAGFTCVDDFEAEPTMLWIRALTHPQSGAAAALYIMPLAGAWYDVTARFDDESSVTLSDNQRELADIPPWAEVVRLEAGTPPVKAYERLLRRTGGRAVMPYTPDNFVEAFEEQYRRSTIWRVKRGDTAEELRRITAAAEGEAPDNAFVQQLLHSRREMRACQIDEMLKEQWLRQSNISAFDYEQLEDRLVVVHELTPPDMLIDIWGERYGEEEIDDPPDMPEVADIVTEQGPREGFRTLQQRLPPRGRFTHHATVEGDISGDLWLRPEE